MATNDKKTERKGAGDQQAPDATASSPPPGDSGADSATGKPSAGGASGGKSGGKAAPRRRRGGRRLFWLLLLLALIAGGYYGWRYYGDELSARLGVDLPPAPGAESDRTGVESDEPVASPSGTSSPQADPDEKPAASAATSESMDASESDRDTDARSSARAREQEKALAALEDRLASVERRLDHQQTRLEEMASTTRRDWLLAEAEYLLRLARQRVLIEKRGDNALSLMTTVDGILEELDDPDLYRVRRPLAREITALRTAEKLDREGLFLELESLIESAQRLEVPRPEAAQEPEPEPAPADGERPWYRQLLDNARQALVALSGIVRVEKLDEPPPPLPTPSEAERLRQGVRLALEQAQLGLMREQQAVFDASLARARELVATRFEKTGTGTAMLERLEALGGTSVNRSLPAPEESLRALRDYMQLRNDRYGDAPGGSGS